MHALLSLVRPIADELVVAVDDRAGDVALAACAAVADTLLSIPHAAPFERNLAWLHAKCSGDWILRIDGDEIPSTELLAAVPDLRRRESVTHYWLLRRWLHGDEARYIDEPPWAPDYQLRLVQNDPRVLRFPGEMHSSAEVAGGARYLDLPLYHADLLLNTLEQREKKAAIYERLRPGLRNNGRPVNYVYLPERLPSLRTAPVPVVDRELLRRFLRPDGGAVPSASTVPVVSVSRAEIDQQWEGRPLAASAYAARLEPVELHSMTAGALHLVFVRVTNLGTECWPSGADARPEIRLTYTWPTNDGEVRAAGLRSAFPAALGPGETAIVPALVVAPEAHGTHVLQFDLVHEHVRWFGCDARVDVAVRPRERRLVLMAGYSPFRHVGDDAVVAANLAQLGSYLPDVRPILVGEQPDVLTQRFGHEAAPSVHHYLYTGFSHDWSALRRLVHLAVRTSQLRRAARRLRRGRTVRLARHGGAFLDLLNSSDAVVGVSAGSLASNFAVDQLWPQAATILAAHELGVPVTITSATVGPFRGFTDRAIAALALQKVAAIAVRDRNRSKKTLRRLGVRQARVSEGYDDSIALPAAPEADVAEALAQVGLREDEDFAAVSLHNSPGAWSSLQAVAAVVRRLSELQIQSVFVPMCLHGDEDDRRLALELSLVVEGSGDVRLLDPLPPDDVIRALVGRARLAIGTRYHLAVFAAAVGVASVGIYGDDYTATKLLGLRDLYPDGLIAVAGTTAADDLVSHAVRALNRERGTPVAVGRLPLIRFLGDPAPVDPRGKRGEAPRT